MAKREKTLEETILTLKRFDKSNKFTIAFIASMVMFAFIQASIIGNNLMLLFMAAAFMTILSLFLQLTENTRAVNMLYEKIAQKEEKK